MKAAEPRKQPQAQAPMVVLEAGEAIGWIISLGTLKLVTPAEGGI